MSLFNKLIDGVFPTLFIFTVIIVSIRITYLLYNKEKIVLYKEVLSLIFILYILLLYYIVTYQDNNYGTNNFILFKEIFRYKIISKLFIRNVLGNILLFVPLGIFSCYYIKVKHLYPILVLSFLISSCIEYIQIKIGRTFDVDDIILNTFGGILGYFIYRYGLKIFFKMPKFMKSQIFLDLLCLIGILFIIYLSFKFDFWRFFS